MSAFDAGRLVEARGLEVLGPFLQGQSEDGRWVLCDKGPLAKFIQESMGDVLFNARGKVWSAELKCELRHTGNLFCETWSNKNLDDQASHAERGSNPGWLKKTKADFLFYYFLDTDDLYIAQMLPLKRWAFGTEPNGGRLDRRRQSGEYEFREVRQRKYVQANDTWGHLVPIKILAEELGSAFTHRKAKQLALIDLGEIA